MRGYIKVALATIAMITIVLSGWKITSTVVEEQVAVAGDLLNDLYLQDFRSCMERDLPPDAPDAVAAIIEEICLKESGLK